jgi:hypothetical protein
MRIGMVCSKCSMSDAYSNELEYSANELEYSDDASRLKASSGLVGTLLWIQNTGVGDGDKAPTRRGGVGSALSGVRFVAASSSVSRDLIRSINDPTST